jgi:hypothetical protein
VLLPRRPWGCIMSSSFKAVVTDQRLGYQLIERERGLHGASQPFCRSSWRGSVQPRCRCCIPPKADRDAWAFLAARSRVLAGEILTEAQLQAKSPFCQGRQMRAVIYRQLMRKLTSWLAHYGKIVMLRVPSPQWLRSWQANPGNGQLTSPSPILPPLPKVRCRMIQHSLRSSTSSSHTITVRMVRKVTACRLFGYNR